jgi:hypothetical protein
MSDNNTEVHQPLLSESTSFFSIDNKSDQSIIVNDFVVNIAKQIFNNITPSNVKPQVSQVDIEYTLGQLNAVINPSQALQYLTVNDNEYMQKLTLAVESGMRNVFSDQAITMSDLPAVFKMVKQIAQSLNAIHNKGTAVVEIGSHTLLPMLEVIIVLVAQMILPPAEFAMLRTVLGLAFDMLSTSIAPMSKQPCCVWLKSLSCLFPQFAGQHTT